MCIELRSLKPWARRDSERFLKVVLVAALLAAFGVNAEPTNVGVAHVGEWPGYKRDSRKNGGYVTLTIDVKGTYAYLAGGKVVDFGIAEYPDVVAGTEETFGNIVAVHGDYLYEAGLLGFSIKSLSDPKKPVTLGSVPIGNVARSFAVANGYAYVTAYGDGLYVIENGVEAKYSQCGV